MFQIFVFDKKISKKRNKCYILETLNAMIKNIKI
jgi:hypothetical protein